MEARLNVAPNPDAVSTAARHAGEAKVESIGRDAVTLSHGPIPSLKWGSMTMEFKLPQAGLPRGLTAGDKVGFEFFMDADGLPQLTAATVLAPAPAAAAASRSKP